MVGGEGDVESEVNLLHILQPGAPAMHLSERSACMQAFWTGLNVPGAQDSH